MEMKKMKKRILTGSIIALFLLASYGGLMVVTDVTAHPPADMQLGYDFENQILNVTITHVTPAPQTHYVYKIDIETKNGLLEKNYESQPTTSVFTYSYPIDAEEGDTITITAYCNIQGSVTRIVTITGENSPPSRPTITGPTSGTTGTSYTYEIVSTDPDNDKIFYCINWDDGSDEFCTNLFNSGEKTTISHTWTTDGNYAITVKATDENEAESDIATLQIAMPKTDSFQQTPHIVLAEMGSTSWCPNCPRADERITEIFSSGLSPFYYVTLVYDLNTIAAKRGRQLSDSYIPMLYLDGGYQVVDSTTGYSSAITTLANRDVHPLKIELTAEWKGNADIEVTVNVINEGTGSYLGHLRVYMTEITSRWNNQEGEPYHYGFLDYAFDRYIRLPEGGTYMDTTAWSGSSDHGGQTYGDITPDNIMVIGAVSHWLPHLQENPWTDPRPYRFFAQYVDQTTAALVTSSV